MKKLLLTCLMLFVALGLFAGAKGEKASGSAAAGPKSDAPTIADMKGIPAGKYQGQYELAEYEKLSGKKLEFKQNPIFDNAGLPPVAERLPKDVMVLPPYNEIGKYGGTYRAMSRGPESGTSEVLSIRHVNLVRMTDDLKAIVPDVAKDYEWNSLCYCFFGSICVIIPRKLNFVFVRFTNNFRMVGKVCQL